MFLPANFCADEKFWNPAPPVFAREQAQDFPAIPGGGLLVCRWRNSGNQISEKFVGLGLLWQGLPGDSSLVA